MRNIIKLGLSATLFLAVTAAQAALVIEESMETYDPELGYGVAEYTVINNTSSDVYAFIVANDTATNVWSTNNGWNSAHVYASWWDDAASNINYLGGVDNPISTSSLGAFADLFSGYDQALMYTFNYYNANGLADNPDAQPIAAGATVAGFQFTTAELASPYIAIDMTGNIVGVGEAVHVVPVPAAVWLFASGLLGLAGIARRRA